MTNKPPLLVKYVEVSKSDGNYSAEVEFKFDLSGMKTKSGYTPCLLFYWLAYSEDPTSFPGWNDDGSNRYSYKHTVRNITDTITLYAPTVSGYGFPYKVKYGSATTAGNAYELSKISGYSGNNLRFKLSRTPYSASYVGNAWKSSVTFYFFIREHPEIYQTIEVPI